MEHLRELEEIDDREYVFLRKIRLQTWCLIISPLCEWCHDAGSYYQMESRCHFLDGCGEVKEATLYLTAGYDELEAVEAYKNAYKPGTLHLLDISHFNLVGNDITFYHPQTIQVASDEGHYVMKWFDEYEARLKLRQNAEITSTVRGTVNLCRVVKTNHGENMAFIDLLEQPDISVVVFPEQYAVYKNLIDMHYTLSFDGRIESGDNSDDNFARNKLIVTKISI